MTHNIYLENKSQTNYNTYLSTIISEIGDSYYLTNFWAYRCMIIDGNSYGGIRCYQDSINGIIQFTSDSFSHTSVWTGIEEPLSASISTFPNPVKEKLKLTGLKETIQGFKSITL